MGFEPQKFFIGLVDFFSVLMPGALLTYLGKDWAASSFLRQDYFLLDGAEAWLLFLFASYLLGHFVFLVGTLLDELLYDPFRGCTYWGQVQRLSRGQSLSPREWRKLAASQLFFGQRADAAVIPVERMKARALQPLSAEHAVNAFQWSKARLSVDCPEGLAAVQRLEADSKFFRSFVVVLAALAIVFLIRQRETAALICAGLIVPAFWRYVDQRFKGTQQAYWLVLALDGEKDPSGPPASSSRKTKEPTRAGGVVFRERDKTVQYLMVQASDNRGQLVLPKGHVEPGEQHRIAAVREVKEETGHWARVLRWIGDERLSADPNEPPVRLYLMISVGDREDEAEVERWPQENRQPQWLAFAKAKAVALDETKAVLDTAEKARAAWVGSTHAGAES